MVKRIELYSYFIIFFLICACNSVPTKEINTENKRNNIKIRYLNVAVIFDYMINRDPDAVIIKKQKEDLLKSIDEMNKKNKISDEGEKQGLLEELEVKQGYLLKLKSDEDYYKGKILNEINSAIESIAGRDDIDFVFNIGEGAVFARKEYDITERVLQEIENRAKRNAPVSR